MKTISIPRTKTKYLTWALCGVLSVSLACGPNATDNIQTATSAESGLLIIAWTTATYPAPAAQGVQVFFNAVLADIKKIVGEAKEITGFVSSITGAVSIVTTVLSFLGFIHPDDEVADLTADLKAVGTGIAWEVVQSYIDMNYGPVLGAIDGIADEPTTVTAGSGDDINSRNGVINLEMDAAWTRATIGAPNDSASDGGGLTYSYYSPTTNNPFYPFPSFDNSMGNWKNTVSARNTEKGSHNLVFDWQMGAPFLMKAISARLLIMAHIKPNFRTSTNPADRFDAEVGMMHDALRDRYNTMLEGIQCGTKNVAYTGVWDVNIKPVVYSCAVVCADIYTGISATTSVTPTPPTSGTPWPVYNLNNISDMNPYRGPSPLDTSAKCENLAPDVLTNAYFGTSSFVKSKMPLFEMRSMIDVLYTILHPHPDLTQTFQQISSEGTNDLCIEAFNFFGWSRGPLQLSPCNGSATQRWSYNRLTGQIINPADPTTCIRTRNVSDTPNLLGTPITAESCDLPTGSLPQVADPAQQWSYDAEQKLLINGNGVILRSSNLTAGASIYAADPAPLANKLFGAQWHADGPVREAVVDIVGMANVDGDSGNHNDVVGVGRPGTDEAGHIFVGIASDTGVTYWSWVSPTRMVDDGAQIWLADLDGDHKVDLVAQGVAGGAHAGWVSVGQSDGRGFTQWSWTSGQRVVDDGSTTLLADVDGDQRPDLVTVGAPGGATAGWVSVRLSVGVSFPQVSWTSGHRMIDDGSKVWLADVDGDANHMADLVAQGAAGGGVAGWVVVGLREGAAGFKQWSWVSGQRMLDDGANSFLADVNGDHKADLVTVGAASGPNPGWVSVGLSNGLSFPQWTWTSGHRMIDDGSKVWLADVDGDANHTADLVTVGAASGPNPGWVAVGLSNGQSFSQWSWTSGQRMVDDSATTWIADLNGDGRADLTAQMVRPGLFGPIFTGLSNTSLSNVTSFGWWSWFW